MGWFQTFVSIAVALVLVALPVRAEAGNKTLDLGDGYRFELLGAGEAEAGVGHSKTITISVAVTDNAVHDNKTRLIEAADRMFESVLLNAAENGNYVRAIVTIRRPSVAAFEDFLFVRGKDEVWLRQAGASPWKIAQDPAAWRAPPSQAIELDKFGTFAVEAAAEIQAPTGFKRAAEIDFATKTPLIDIQRKLRETKALWARIDRTQLIKDGFDLIVLGNFATPQRGRFHARKGFFVRIPRMETGEWAELPDRVPDNRDALISQTRRPADALVQTIAYQFTFGGSPETLRFANFSARTAVSPHLAPMPTAVAYGFMPAAHRIEAATALDLRALSIVR